MSVELNPDRVSWQEYADCANVTIPFDGISPYKRVEEARNDPIVTRLARVCAGCVVREDCLRELQDMPRTSRNEGSVQAGMFVGKKGALLDLLQP